MKDMIGLIGGTGWLGQGIAEHLIQSGLVEPEQLVISNQSARHIEAPWAQACTYTVDNQVLVDSCDIIFLAVRPQQMNAVDITVDDQLVISIMAGMTIQDLMQRTRAKYVVRSMPNAALSIGESFTPWYADDLPDNAANKVAELLSTFGEQARVDDEDQVNFFTAMTGSGQGILSYFASCMIDAAVGQGVTQSVAEQAVRQLFSGTGRLVKEEQETPHQMVDICLDYAGTTAAAIQSLQSNGLSSVIDQALLSAYQLAASDMSQG